MSNIPLFNENEVSAAIYNTAQPGEIQSSTLGSELTEQECHVLAELMEVRHLNDNEYLIHSGEPVSTLFLLTSGKLDVYGYNHDAPGHDKVIYTMRPGECAGRRAFVDRTPRQATLRSVGHTVVYTLEPVAFETLIEKNPNVLYKVMRALFRSAHCNLMDMNRESEQLANYITRSKGRY